MKKNYFNKNLSKIEDSLNNELPPKFKTTDINVLLNRVRLEKKKTINKRIFISLCLVTSISLLAVFFIIKS